MIKGLFNKLLSKKNDASKETEVMKESKSMDNKMVIKDPIKGKLKILLQEVDYFHKNKIKMAEEIYEQYDGKNLCNVYKNAIVKMEDKIDELEEKCELKNSCHAGCNACCYQLIGLNPYERKIITEAVMHLTSKERKKIKLKAEENVRKLERTGFCVKHKSKKNDEDYTKGELIEYIQLNLRCPLLNDENMCMIYETRPCACWSYRNYGCKEECEGNLAKHGYAYETAINPVIEALSVINYEKVELDDFVILPVFLKEIL